MLFKDVQIQKRIRLLKQVQLSHNAENFHMMFEGESFSFEKKHLFQNKIMLSLPKHFLLPDSKEQTLDLAKNAVHFMDQKRGVHLIVYLFDPLAGTQDLHSISHNSKKQIWNSMKNIVFLKSTQTQNTERICYKIMRNSMPIFATDVFYKLEMQILHVSFACPYKNYVQWEKILDYILQSIRQERKLYETIKA